MLKKQFTCHVLLILALFIFYIPWICAAPVYKSKDAEGNITYSSEPPPQAQQVEEVAVPKNPPSSAESAGSSVDEIRQKANALEQENAAREKEIQKQKQQQKPTGIVTEEPPVQTKRPIIQNRPIGKPPGSGTPPVAKPLPNRAK
ncbi:DUF4124 domain-containing protein [Kaarinaea lacus]